MSRHRFFRPILLTLSLLLTLASPLFAQWDPDQRLTVNDSTSLLSFGNAWCVAGSHDTVHAVWYDHRDGNDELYYKRSTNGGVFWDADARLTQNDSASTYPTLATLGSRLHLVWQDRRDGNDEIYYKTSSDGGSSWGNDTRLTSDPANSWTPSAAVLGSRVHVVWDDRRDGNREVYHKRSTDGGTTWSPDARLTNDVATSGYPAVALGDSLVHVVWYDFRDTNWEIYYKRSTDAGATWGGETRLTTDAATSWTPSVAAAGAKVHVVWQDSRDGNREVYYKRSTDSGATWGSDVRLTASLDSSWAPSVTSSGSNVHIVWWDRRDGNREIYYKRSTDEGTTWEADLRLTSDPAGSSTPSVAVSGMIVHVLWADLRPGNSEIFYKRNPTGNPSGIETGSEPGKETREPSLKVFPNPFTSFARIPGHEQEDFALYDVSGRLVATHKGSRVGEGLAPGVYFLSSSDGKEKPLRIVKVR